MADYGVADLDAFDTLANLFHPAGVLMTHDIRELDIDLAAPDAFDDVQVGAANAGAADTHDNVCGFDNAGIGDVLVAHEFGAAKFFVECMQHRCFHGLRPPCMSRRLRGIPITATPVPTAISLILQESSDWCRSTLEHPDRHLCSKIEHAKS